MVSHYLCSPKSLRENKGENANYSFFIYIYIYILSYNELNEYSKKIILLPMSIIYALISTTPSNIYNLISIKSSH